MNLFEEKQALRKEVRTRLASLSDEDIASESKLVQAKLFELSEYQSAKNISIYLSLRKEVDTIGIIENALRSGKKVYVPRITKDNLEMVHLESLDDIDGFVENKWLIKEPLSDYGYVGKFFDLIIAPGLGFDTDGNKLGHGGGYYDKFFDSLGTVPPIVGLALSVQMLDKVPCEEHDYRLDKIISP